MFTPTQTKSDDFYPIYEKVRGCLVDGEYVVLNANGIVERSSEPISLHYEGTEDRFIVRVFSGDLSFYEQLHKVKCTYPVIPDIVHNKVIDLLRSVSEESGSTCRFTIKKLSSSRGRVLEVLPENHVKKELKPSEQNMDDIEDILYMLESLGNDFYHINIQIEENTYWMQSPFEYFTIYSCLPEYKYIEGDYPYTEDEKVLSFRARLELGLVYLEDEIIGFVKPKRLVDKL